jgi:hypothetical protein
VLGTGDRGSQRGALSTDLDDELAKGSEAVARYLSRGSTGDRSSGYLGRRGRRRKRKSRRKSLRQDAPWAAFPGV